MSLDAGVPAEFRAWRHDAAVRERFRGWIRERLTRIVKDCERALADLDEGFVYAAWGRVCSLTPELAKAAEDE